MMTMCEDDDVRDFLFTASLQQIVIMWLHRDRCTDDAQLLFTAPLQQRRLEVVSDDWRSDNDVV